MSAKAKPRSQKKPTNLLEAIRYFSDLDVATDYVAKLRWPNGPTCPRCGSQEYSYLTTRRIWKCKGCEKQYSVKLGTIFEDSPLGLDKWLPAVWLAANSKNGISSHELARALGVTQKSAWFMLHRIRLAMQQGSITLSGEVEVDESYVGGKAINMHKDARVRKGALGGGTVGSGKVPVLGLRERGGRIRAEVVPDVKRRTLKPAVERTVEKGSTVYTDANRAYIGLDDRYDHGVVDHAEAYVDGRVHCARSPTPSGSPRSWAPPRGAGSPTPRLPARADGASGVPRGVRCPGRLVLMRPAKAAARPSRMDDSTIHTGTVMNGPES